MTDHSKGTIVLSAGGTGGHLFPAEALAHQLLERGWRIQLMTDGRAKKFADGFPADALHVVESGTPSGKNPIRLFKALMALSRGTRQSRAILKDIQPAAVVGFGGYPTIPPLWAACGNYPTVIHEQNAVMGRANRLLATRVDRIAGGFLKATGPHADKIVETGNPVRPAVLAQIATAYGPPSDEGLIRLVIFGGSQGARYFSQTLPDALNRLPDAMRSRLWVTQQARPEDEDAARAAYAALGVRADVAPFFDDLPALIGSAHLVIARSGASTVSEISAIGRPAILVPYPHALDHDQAANAAALEARGGALMRRQSELDADRLGDMINELIGTPGKLAEMAAHAKEAGRPDAVRLLADLTEGIARSAAQ